VLIIASLAAVAYGDDNNNISIGALVYLTGDGSSSGINSKAALEMAANDVNSYQEKIGSEDRICLRIEDTGSDPAKALRELKNLSQDGTKVVIAATSSAELAAIKDYADENGIMIIGTASTAPSLAIPGDNLIRLAPDDTNQGFAMAQVLKMENISAIVPITRGDLWGDDLLNATAKNFEVDGGKVLQGIRYSPGDDLSSEVEALSSLVKEAKSSYGSVDVGVYIVSLDEASSILALAAKYPELSSVKWFGSDGTAGSDIISENSTLAQFASKVGLVSPYLLAFSDEQRYKKVQDAIMQETGSKPNFYAFASYDALWVCAESMTATKTADSGQIKEALIHTINRYNGITSILNLNDADDKERATYDLIEVKEASGSYSWQSKGQFAKYSPGDYEINWKGQTFEVD